MEEIMAHWRAKYKFDKKNAVVDPDRNTVPQPVPFPCVSMTKWFLQSFVSKPIISIPREFGHLFFGEDLEIGRSHNTNEIVNDVIYQ